MWGTTGERSVDETGGYPRQAAPAPVLDREEDRRLFVRLRATGDDAVRDALVRRHLPLAKRLARRYARPGDNAEDLVQVASVGLVLAVDRFDPSREASFSSFAVPTILGELRRYFRDHGWALRPPRDLQETALRVDRVSSELRAQTGRTPSAAQVAEKCGLTIERVLEALEAAGAQRAISLEGTAGSSDGDEDLALRDRLGEEERGYGRAEDTATLERLAAVLDPREREVLRLRFEEDLTQSEIGERLGISQMHVSRLIRRSLQRLQAIAAARP